MRKKRCKGLQAAIKAAGGLSAFARLLGITPQSVIKWDRVPRKRIVAIEQKTGVARELLAPELYR